LRRSLYWLCLFLVACGGKASADAINGDGGAPSSQDETVILRDVPAICREGLNASCVTAGDYNSCTHNLTALITNAAPECLDRARDAVGCFADKGVECLADGASTSGECEDALEAANSCILARTDWTKVGCVAFHEPSDSGGVDSCTVTCGTLSATCTSIGPELSCVCDAGSSKGRVFRSADCPLASGLATACAYQDILDQR
jgi:hypothetical protein